MSQAVSPATGCAYGLARVARVWRLSRATVYRHRGAAGAEAPARPTRRGPVGACPDAELAERIRTQILGSRLHGEGCRKIWARLRHVGIRTSARRVRRLMGRHGLLAPHRVGRPTERAHDGTITTTAVDAMWGTDMTETVTLREGRARVFVAVDHCSGECVGSHAARSGNRFEALEPVRQGVLRHFGSVERNAAKGLGLRHDHGSNHMSRDFQDEIRFLGIESSPSFTPPAGGQRRRGTLHPHPEGELLVGAQLRHHRGPEPRAAGLRRPLQRHLARRPTRLPHPEPDPRRATLPCSMPTGQPTLGRLNSAASCLKNRSHYTGTAPPRGGPHPGAMANVSGTKPTSPPLPRRLPKRPRRTRTAWCRACRPRGGPGCPRRPAGRGALFGREHAWGRAGRPNI